MSAPMPWPQIKLLLESNVAQRFRVKQPDAAKRAGIIRQLTQQTVGRWGFCTIGDSILLGIEDPEDIGIIKRLFYKGWRRPR